jgi:hypothetical protein
MKKGRRNQLKYGSWKSFRWMEALKRVLVKSRNQKEYEKGFYLFIRGVRRGQ